MSNYNYSYDDQHDGIDESGDVMTNTLSFSRNASHGVYSRLPSFQAMHSVGGATLARRRLAEERGRMRMSVNDEEYNASLLHSSSYPNEQNPVQDGHYAEIGMNYSTLTLPRKSYLESFSYKDLPRLREIHCSMEKKKEIRRKLLADHGRTDAGISLSSSSNTRWRKLKEDLLDTSYQLKLWGSSIHEIEGRFGTGIRSYFDLLRRLFLLNLSMFFLTFLFLVLPTVVFEYYKDSGYILLVENQQGNISQQCVYDPYNPNEINSFPQYVIWWFTGEGFMENTLLFIGYYDNAKTTVVVPGFSFFYDLPLAYLLVAFFYFFISLVVIVRRASAGVRRSLITDDQLYSYCNLVFGGWDFCITDDKAALLKKKSLKYELQANLDEERIRKEQANRTQKEKVYLYAMRFLINIVVLGVLTAALTAIFYASEFSLRQTSSNQQQNFIVDLLITYLTSIAITGVNFIAPFIFEALVSFEGYTPEFAVRFTLIRVVFLRLASVIFLYVIVYLQINCSLLSFSQEQFVPACGFCNGTECWETHFGQEMYKLTLFDFLAVVGVTLFVEFPRKLIADHCSCGLAKWLGQQEFSIPINVLDIVYAQTLGWIGAFYSPLIPAMMVIKFFIYFYLKKLTLVYNCRPSERPYRASKFASFFFYMLMLALLVAAVPVAFSVGFIKPSIDCGPFRRWNLMFDAVTLSIQSTLPASLQQVMWFVGNSSFAVLVIVLLGLVLYYFVALSSAHEDMISVLKNQLKLEGKDKQFLLSRFNQLSEELKQHQPLSNLPYNVAGNAVGQADPYNDGVDLVDELPGQARSF